MAPMWRVFLAIEFYQLAVLVMPIARNPAARHRIGKLSLYHLHAGRTEESENDSARFIRSTGS
jgi:hypothetical protein